MGFIDAAKHIDWGRIWLVIMAVIPYFDKDILGVIPIARDFIPEVDPIYWWQLSWTERGRLAVLWIIPYFDAEVIELLTGKKVNEVIAD